MALVGTYIHKEFKTSETEFQDYEMVHPQYEEGHPLFDKSGTTEKGKSPISEEITQEYKDIYLIVRAASTHQRVGSDGIKTLYLSTMIALYQDQNHKNEDFFNEIWQEIIDIPIDNLDEMKSYNNPFDFAYAKIKEREEFQQLIND